MQYSEIHSTPGLSAVTVRCAKTAEPIDLPFGLWPRVVLRKPKFNPIRQVASMCPRGMAPIGPHGRAH